MKRFLNSICRSDSVSWLRGRLISSLPAAIVAGLLSAGASRGFAAATLTDNGATTPTPGANDIYQTSTTGNKTSPNSDNYYDNNGSTGTGESFKTGGSTLTLTGLYIKTGGLGSGSEPGQTDSHKLFIYVTNSSAANKFTLLTTYTVTAKLNTDGDWWLWGGLTNIFTNGVTYAFSMYDSANYEAMAVSTVGITGGSGGLAVINLPASGSGTDTPVTGYNAVFDAVMASSCSAPNPPTGLSATTSQNNSVPLSWTAPSSGVTPTGYAVLRSTTTGTGYTTLSAGANVSGTSFTDSTAVNGTTYYYVVEALNGSSCASANSGQASATPCTAPGTPTIGTATGGGGFVTVTWTAPSGGATPTGYEILRSTSTGTETALTSVGTSPTSYTDTSVTGGTTYFYEVQALQGGCDSSSSGEVSATPCTAAAAPTGLSGAPASGQITVSWTAPGGSPSPTGYNVKRATTKGAETTLSGGGNVSGTSFVDTTTVNGTAYYYVISSLVSGCESTNSSEISVNVPTLADDTSTAPTPGTYDIYQTSTTGNAASPSGVSNYFSNNNGAPGEKFTTGSSSAGYIMTDLYLQLGNGNGNTFSYATTNDLVIYSISGTTATPVVTNVVTIGGSSSTFLSTSSPGDWIHFGGLFVQLNANTTYAYTLVTPAQGGNNPYTGLENTSGTTVSGSSSARVVEITPGGGSASVTTGTGEDVFDLVLTPACTTPTAPTIGTATPGGGQVTVTWTAPSGGATITGYNVLRSTTSGSGYTLLTTVSGSTTSYVDMSAANGTTYYYVIQTVEYNCDSANSGQVSGTPCTPGGSPTGVSATPSSGSVILSWTAPSGSPSGYNVKRSTTSGAEITLSAGANISGTSFTDTTAVNGTTYYYEVSALVSGGCESANSSEVSAIPCSMPSAPTIGTTTIANSQVTVTWTAPSGVITGYNVKRSTTSGAETTLSAGANVTGTSFTDTTAVDGTTYYYEVSALQGGCESVNSGEITGTPCNVANPPTGVTTALGNGQVTINWTAPSSGPTPTGYNVKRSTTSGAEVTLSAGANVSGTSFTDTTAVNGQAYYYVVSSLNGGSCEGANSAEATANVPNLTDIGSSNPTPGTYDISQLSTSGFNNDPDGLNYFDNNNGGTYPPGQTFTTISGTYELTSLALHLGPDYGNGHQNAQVYTLYVYSMSGSTATLLSTYTSSASVTLTNPDWIEWTGLTNVLNGNTQYAYGFKDSAGYSDLYDASGNPYSGGELALIPASGGTITTGSSHGYDATFDIGLLALCSAPGITSGPSSVTNCAGSSATFSVSATGTSLQYLWYTNGVQDTSAALGSSSYNIASVTPANAGTYSVIVSNSCGTVTSTPPATLTVNVAPTAGAASYSRGNNIPLIISIANLLTNVTSYAGDTLVLTGVGTDGFNLTTTNGATLATNSSYIFYTNSVTPNVADSFLYTVSGSCGVSTGTVNIAIVSGLIGQTNPAVILTSTNATLTFYGIPGTNYDVERATNLTPPVTWVDLGTTNAPANGVFQVIDSFSDLGNIAPPQAYWQLVYP